MSWKSNNKATSVTSFANFIPFSCLKAEHIEVTSSLLSHALLPIIWASEIIFMCLIPTLI